MGFYFYFSAVAETHGIPFEEPNAETHSSSVRPHLGTDDRNRHNSFRVTGTHIHTHKW